jgi:hypothetical protein
MQNIGNVKFTLISDLEPNTVEIYDFEEEIISSTKKICKI